MEGALTGRYAVVETKDLVETHRLIDQETGAEVVVAPVRGGMVTRFRIGDDDILFLDQATLRDHQQNVRGGIPILFPFAGRLAGDEFVDEGERLSMPQHGFARKLPWRICATHATDHDGAAITMALEDSDATRSQWPFHFRLTFRYHLRDGALIIDQKYENRGDRPLPMHPGLHPYFQLEDWRKREARIPTNATRVFDNRTGETKALEGPLTLGSTEVDLQLLDHGQSAISLLRPGAAPIQVSYDSPDTVITIWSLPSRDFVCVEPWTRQSDALNRGQALIIPVGEAHDSRVTIART